MKFVTGLAVVLLATLALGCDSGDAAVTCAEVQQTVSACYDGDCASNDSAFCGCWTQGMDLDLLSCECITQDLDALCEVYNLTNFSTDAFDCASAGAYLDSQCVP